MGTHQLKLYLMLVSKEIGQNGNCWHENNKKKIKKNCVPHIKRTHTTQMLRSFQHGMLITDVIPFHIMVCSAVGHWGIKVKIKDGNSLGRSQMLTAHCLPHTGQPWHCPRGPCCWPHSPGPGCSRPRPSPTRTGCRFRSGSTPGRRPPRGFHPCWSHAGPAGGDAVHTREVTATRDFRRRVSFQNVTLSKSWFLLWKWNALYFAIRIAFFARYNHFF